MLSLPPDAATATRGRDSNGPTACIRRSNSAGCTRAAKSSERAAATAGRHLQPFFARSLAARCFTASEAFG
jgi:hypothetical protein